MSFAENPVVSKNLPSSVLQVCDKYVSNAVSACKR